MTKDKNTGKENNNSIGEKKGPAKKKKTALSFAIEFFVKIAVTALVVVILCVFVVGIYVNHSNSCYPMIKDGDLVITCKFDKKYAAGDAIAYRRDEKVKFGRIVAKAGDVVDISEGNLIINGYGTFENAVYPTPAEGSKIKFPYTVPEDTVFVLNDYRSDLKDSRTYGGIPVNETNGKVFLMLRRRGF